MSNAVRVAIPLPMQVVGPGVSEAVIVGVLEVGRGTVVVPQVSPTLTGLE